MKEKRGATERTQELERKVAELEESIGPALHHIANRNLRMTALEDRVKDLEAEVYCVSLEDSLELQGLVTRAEEMLARMKRKENDHESQESR